MWEFRRVFVCVSGRGLCVCERETEGRRESTRESERELVNLLVCLVGLVLWGGYA